jgi:hypothetical protein
MIQLADDFTLSRDTTLGELEAFFKRFNASLTKVKIGDCLITPAWGKDTVTAVEKVINPMMTAYDDDESIEGEP